MKILINNPVDKEWDGLARLCFTRKNKTLSGIFRHKPVLKLLAANYKTYCSLKNEPLDEEFKKNPEEYLKKKVTDVLQQCGVAEERMVKVDNDKLLELLTTFNKNGIHFT